MYAIITMEAYRMGRSYGFKANISATGHETRHSNELSKCTHIRKFLSAGNFSD